MLIRSPGAGEVEASAELIVTDAIRCDGRVLIEKGIGHTKLQPERLSTLIGKFVDRAHDRSQRIGLDERVGGYL